MRKSLSKTPAPKSDRIYGSKVNPKGSASSEKSAKSIKLSSDIILALTNKLKEFKENHNTKKVTLSDLKAVYRRGLGAYSSSHRPTISGGKPNTRNAWAMARVNAFLRKAGGGEYKKAYVQDDDLLKMHLGGDMSKHLAPNGKPSNLTPEQYRLVRTPEFKAWFGDWEKNPKKASKVVDENGEPLVVYHSTNKQFNVFEEGKNTIGTFGRGIYFANSKDYASDYNRGENQKILSVFLNITNPIIIKNKIMPNGYENYSVEKMNENKGVSRDFTIKAKSENYNGVIAELKYGDVEFVAFYPTQIKLADGKNTTFDGSNPDIRYDDGGEVDKLIEDGIVELKMYDTTNEHSKIYGFDAQKPLYIQSIIVSEEHRGKGIGSKVMEYILDYANKNGHDVIFGHITQKAEPSIDVIKSMIQKSGFNTIEGNNDFYKVMYNDGGEVDANFTPIFKWREMQIEQEDGSFISKPMADFFLWVYDNNDAQKKLDNGIYEYAYPNSDFGNDLEKIWQDFKQYKGSEHIIGFIIGNVYEYFLKEGYWKMNIGIMTTRPNYRRKGVNEFAIKYLRDKFELEKEEVSFYEPTEQGQLFINSRKFANGGEVDEHKETYKKWKSLVNMSYSELKRFYDSEEGKVAGLKPSEAKAQGIDSGRESARWIMKMKKTPVSEWTPTMWKWAKKQISFISRMSGAKGDLYDDKGNKTRKYLSLLIWGNDPKKKNNGGMIKYNVKVTEGLSDESQKQMLQSSLEKLKYYKDKGYTKERLIESKKFTKSWLDKYYEDGGVTDVRMEDTVQRMDDPNFADISYYKNGGETKNDVTYKDVVELLKRYQFRERQTLSKDKRYKSWRNSTKVNGEEVDCFIDTENKLIVLDSQHGLREIGYDLKYMESYFKKNRLKMNKYNDGGETDYEYFIVYCSNFGFIENSLGQNEHKRLSEAFDTLFDFLNGENGLIWMKEKKVYFEIVKNYVDSNGIEKLKKVYNISGKEALDLHNKRMLENGGTINQSINTNIMDEVKFNQLPHIDTISNNDNILIKESVFVGNLDKPKYIGDRYIHCQVMGDGGMINSLNLKVFNSVGANALRVGEVITRPITNILNKGRKLVVKPIADALPTFKQGGLNPDNKEVKQYFAHDSGNAGGVLVGKRHSEGGIKAINKGTGQPLEMEGGEVVITRGAVSNPKKYQFQGKELTTREILSKLNVDGGGVSFAEGGDVPDKMNCGCDKMDFGGTTMSIQDFVNRSDSEYQEHRLKAGIQKERHDHYDTLSKLNAGTITIEQALREIAQKEMKLDSKYPFGE